MWNKKGTCKNLDEYVFEMTGKSISELMDVQKKYEIKNLDVAKRIMLNAVKSGKKIFIVGDYDADGIDSLIIFTVLCMILKADYSIIVPKRMSEGYGISEKILERLDDGALLITVDNGIRAIETLKKAKEEKHMEIIIMDHHLAEKDENENPVLPEADLIIDPEALEGSSDFKDYCGAGLAFKLAEEILGSTHPMIPVLSCFAAIGTIGDLVPLLEDNRRIVQMGLYNLNHKRCYTSLTELRELFSLPEVKASDIAFKIGPAVNAMGRLYDAGGEMTIKCLMQNTIEKAKVGANTLFENNKKRKEIVQEVVDKIDFENSNEPINFLCDRNIGEGVVGIIAGRMSEENYKPSFVMTKLSDGTLKGSARAKDDVNHIERLLSECSDLLIKFGGHAKAGGFSLEEKNLTEFKRRLCELTLECSKKEDTYDLVLNPQNAKKELERLEQIEPFGEGLPYPIYMIDTIIMNEGEKEFYKIIGTEQNHIKFDITKNLQGIAFHMKEKFFEDGKPRKVKLYGTLNANIFRGVKSAQFQVIDYEIVD